MSVDGLDPTLVSIAAEVRKDAVAQSAANLSQHLESHRIKKLLFGTHQESWENDRTIIDSIPMEVLLEALLTKFSTFERCRVALHHRANSLNRRKIYLPLAAAVLRQLRVVFRLVMAASSLPATATMMQSATQISSDTAMDRSSNAEIYLPVVEYLTRSKDLAIVKAFLITLGRYNPEVDDRAVDTDLLSLVQTAHQRAFTPIRLRQNLFTVLRPYSSSSAARRVANVIWKAFQPLYDMPITASPSDLAMLESKLVHSCEGDHVKILLYSILYGPYADSPQQRILMASKSLRGLLKDAIEYCPSYKDFESKLTILSHCIDTSDAICHTIKTMLTVFHSYYGDVRVAS